MESTVPQPATITPALLPYKRYELTDVDKRLIAMKVQQAQLMKNVPAMMKRAAQVTVAFKFLLETKGLVEKVKELRKERGFQFLDDDADFMEHWQKIQDAANANQALPTLKMAMAENIKLTHEINQHLRALSRPQMKTYK